MRFRHALAIAAALAAAPAAADGPHPLDPLAAAEYEAFVAALRDAGHVDEATRFPHIRLEEPAKSEVLAWSPGTSVDRKAFGVVRQGTDVYEALVDLGSGALLAYDRIDGAQSSVLLEEWGAAQEAATGNAEFAAALAARGADPETVFCAPFSMGYFGIDEHEDKRLLKVGCFDIRPATNNWFGWPIEGLYAVVDLADGTVLSVHDSGEVPISPANLNFVEDEIGDLREPMKPVSLATPAGANFTIEGNVVDWQKWRFHVQLDRRVGMILSTVAYDGRSVLYQAYLSEMFVPYMDTDYGWYSRTYFDTGEYGAGMLASSLVAGIDCPETATFLSATINDDEGNPFEMPGVICIFERNTGDPAWRHAELLNETYEGRPGVELVVRFIPTIGNYDYLVDTVFNTAGEIDFKVGATGIDALRGVAAVSLADASADQDTTYGTLVAPNLAAIYHDHYFSFRLDLDVDGPQNTLVRDSYVKTRLDGPRRSIYRVQTEPVTTEAGIQLGHDVAKWRVINPSKTNSVGNPVSYEIMHHAHTMLLMDEDDWPARRGAFAFNPLWVTPHDPAQRYAGGDYVFGSKGEDGLAVWTRAGRPVEDEDIVLWVTVGMNHLTRAEDIPVMPSTWHGFKLRPFNFHDRNPALDLRSRFAAD